MIASEAARPIADVLTDHAVEARQLSRQIYDLLKLRIVHGKLMPGQRLALRDIAHTLGVSVAPVRDALNLLATEGLVTISPRRGTIVTPLSLNDLRELYQIRQIIDPTAAKIAATNLTAKDLNLLRELLDMMDQISIGPWPDLETFIHWQIVDGEFHALIVKAVGNKRLDTVYQGIWTNLIVARATIPNLYLRTNPDRQDEHRRIFEALVARNGKRASEAMSLHLGLIEQDTFGCQSEFAEGAMSR